MRDQQLQRLDVGGDRGAIKRRRVRERVAAHRRRVHLADERLVRVGALVEQQRDQVERRALVREVVAQLRAVVRVPVRGRVAHLDGVIERAVVHVCAEVDELRREVEAIVDDRDHQRRGAIAVASVQVRAGRDEPPHDAFVAIARGPHQRREAAGGVVRVLAVRQHVHVGLRVRIRACREQRVDDRLVPFGRGPHQRRLLLEGLLRVRVRAVGEQQAHGFETTRLRRGHQRRLAVGMCEVGARAGIEQRLHDARIAGSARLQQRGDAVLVRGVRIGARGRERLHHLDIGVVRGP